MSLEQLQEQLQHAQGLLASRKPHEAALAFEALRDAPGTPNNIRILALDGLGRCCHALGDFDAAEHAFAEALRLLKMLLGHDHLHVAGALQNLARAQSAQGRAQEACIASIKALDILRRHAGETHPRVADALLNLSSFHYEAGDYTRAEAFLRQAMEIWEAAVGHDSVEVSTCLNNLGRLHEQNGRPAEGAILHEQAVDIRTRLLGDHPETAFSLGNWGAALADAGQWSKAVQALEQAVACYERLHMHGEEAAEICRQNLARCREALAAG